MWSTPYNFAYGRHALPRHIPVALRRECKVQPRGNLISTLHYGVIAQSLLLQSADRDRAFELLEDYIERESESGEREDFDRIRGLVPHMRKRLWKASSKEQVQESRLVKPLHRTPLFCEE